MVIRGIPYWWSLLIHNLSWCLMVIPTKFDRLVRIAISPFLYFPLIIPIELSKWITKSHQQPINQKVYYWILVCVLYIKMPYTTKMAYSLNCTGSKLHHILVSSLLSFCYKTKFLLIDWLLFALCSVANIPCIFRTTHSAI